MKAWQISVTAGGRRSTTGGEEKNRVAKAGWDSSPREKPPGRRCPWGFVCGALLSVYIGQKSRGASLGASHRSLPGLGDGVLATADVQPGWEPGSPWEPRRVVSVPFQSLSPSFNHLLTQARLFLRHSRHNFPRRAAPQPGPRPPLGAARTPLPGRIVPPLLIVREA